MPASPQPPLREQLPEDWRRRLPAPVLNDTLPALEAFLAAEAAAGQTVFPPRPRIFAALRLTPWQEVRAVILGQDPYHDDGQACGLAFSVPDGTRPPPSLRNIFKELADDLGMPPPASGNLEPWARQGVLLLNTVLTVRAHAANSHQEQGWETVTDALLDAAAARPEPVVFLLWGAPAQRKAERIRAPQHLVLAAPHPSPLSAYRGFLGSRPFSAANRHLAAAGRPVIDWRLPAAPAPVQPELFS
ncbi:MAG: uracil-DNA glycosylase [Lentisphaeria bacterium]